MSDSSLWRSTPATPLESAVDKLVEKAQHYTELRRQAAERRVEELYRRLKYVAFLVADLEVRLVVPKLNELVSRFPQAQPPRKEGASDRIWVDFRPTPTYPV